MSSTESQEIADAREELRELIVNRLVLEQAPAAGPDEGFVVARRAALRAAEARLRERIAALADRAG